jgi:hypothetical protein
VNSDVTRLVSQYQKAGINVKSAHLMYNNWGGYVTQEDVRGLPFHIFGPGSVYKKGACVRLFTSVQIMATGIVNGCSCRDVDATLRLGDLHQQPLRDIISTRNQAYMKLIDEQQRGEFRKYARPATFTRAFTATARPTGRMASRCSHWRNSRLRWGNRISPTNEPKSRVSSAHLTVDGHSDSHFAC